MSCSLYRISVIIVTHKWSCNFKNDQLCTQMYSTVYNKTHVGKWFELRSIRCFVLCDPLGESSLLKDLLAGP